MNKSIIELDKKCTDCLTKPNMNSIKYISLIREVIDIELNLVYTYLLMEQGFGNDKYYTMFYSAIYKNILSLYSALELNSRGLHGPSRIFYRNIYEFLTITKYISIKDDTKLYENWEKGKTISMKNSIFDNINSPKTSSLIDFWDTLCKFTHATSYSQMVKWDEGEIKENFAYISILLYFNYNVLIDHVVKKRVNGYLKKYAANEYADTVVKKREIKKLFTILKNKLNENGKILITDFCGNWVIK